MVAISNVITSPSLKKKKWNCFHAHRHWHAFSKERACRLEGTWYVGVWGLLGRACVHACVRGGDTWFSDTTIWAASASRPSRFSQGQVSLKVAFKVFIVCCVRSNFFDHIWQNSVKKKNPYAWRWSEMTLMPLIYQDPHLTVTNAVSLKILHKSRFGLYSHRNTQI